LKKKKKKKKGAKKKSPQHPHQSKVPKVPRSTLRKVAKPADKKNISSKTDALVQFFFLFSSFFFVHFPTHQQCSVDLLEPCYVCEAPRSRGRKGVREISQNQRQSHRGRLGAPPERAQGLIKGT
jgi:hypothetical protein